MTGFAHGAPCWANAMIPDLAAGKRFYGELFGWTFSEGAPEFGYYTTAFLDGKKVAGLMPKQDGRMPTAWELYFATPDMGGTARKIRDAGGQIITDVMDVGDLGTMLVAADPSGAVFGVWRARAHRGFEVRGEPGSYVWMGLSTREPGLVDAFYRQVFGFEGVTESPMASPGFTPWRLSGQPEEIGCRIVMDESAPAEMPAHFTVFFLADDMDTAIRTTTRLGGKVQVEPSGTPGGPFAVVTDDQGASFGVMAPK
ncbi:VOC family protein [Streptomyces sp. MST-110588]|uniref:VOC family protein n=1 Tax=Streptomyces sp. MST-110588 TaxID=2833628 RepID=UPI001F5D7FE3|nr:VOC family protein [Streptomyces sp. MST-110588]UNO41426.1 VOC family protein [Streptomyces sp. MST-110588]